MHFTKFTTNSGIKIGRGDFLHRGQTDPRSLTAGARGHAGRPCWPVAKAPMATASTAGDQRRAALQCRKGLGKGPRGPEAHQKPSWVACLAGGRRPATQSEAVELQTCRESAMGGGEWRRCSSIPSAGGKRMARRSCSAGRGSRGRRGTAAKSGGHGG
jgi:hypothetical protein